MNNAQGNTVTNAPNLVIVVTGAASGIGAAVARRVARPGVEMVLHTAGAQVESRDRLQAVAETCERSGATCVRVFGDLADEGRARECVDAALTRFGRVDQIVHTAAHVNRALLGKLTRAELNSCLGVMPGALLELATAAQASLEKSELGRIVAVSSFMTQKLDSRSLAPASATAKAAMEMMAKCLALQLAPTGTTVNCVLPGYTRKDEGKLSALSKEGWQQAASITPTRRLGETDEVAAAIQFLLSRDASQITGALLSVDGGLTLE